MNNLLVTKRPSREEWGQIWFEKLQQFHRTKGKTGIHFDRDQVIAFLQTKRDQEVPAWK